MPSSFTPHSMILSTCMDRLALGIERIIVQVELGVVSYAFAASCPLFSQVVNIPNSMTVLTDLLPVSLIMAERKLQVEQPFGN